MTRAAFLAKYPPHSPVSPYTCRQAKRVAEMRRLSRAPASDVATGGMPPLYRDGPSSYRYLWVIDATGIPYIRECSHPLLCGDLPKHTNLTQGGEASIGGELWFKTCSSIFVSGGSGRYPSICPQRLIDAVSVFENYGYTVESLGWVDDDAARYLQAS